MLSIIVHIFSVHFPLNLHNQPGRMADELHFTVEHPGLVHAWVTCLVTAMTVTRITSEGKSRVPGQILIHSTFPTTSGTGQ